MDNATFHWKKYEAAHWILSKLTTSERTPFNSFLIAVSDYTPTPGPPDAYRYNYKEIPFGQIKSQSTIFSNEELDEAINTLNVNKHIDIWPNEKDHSEPILQMKDEGRMAYESLYYLALRDKQKATNLNISVSENTMGDFLATQWYRHKNYIIAILILNVAVITLISQLGCKK